MATYYLKCGSGANSNWAASTTYSLGSYRCTLTKGGAAGKYIYEVTTAGTSGGTEPTWGTTVGGTTTDNTVTWTCRAPDSTTKALNDFQGIVDLAAAGDIVYCAGEQTLTVLVDMDGNSGNVTSGYIKFIGVNSSWTNDGTKFCLNGNSAVANCMKFNNKDYCYFENIEVKNATSHGVYGVTSNSTPLIFYRCSFHNCGGCGFEGNTFINTSLIICCAFYANTSHGVSQFTTSHILFSSLHDNGGSGFNGGSYSMQAIIGCIAYDNNIGFGAIVNSLIMNCVAEGNATKGIEYGASGSVNNMLFGCRVTNHNDSGDIGVTAASKPIIMGWNYFEDNYGDNVQTISIAGIVFHLGSSNQEDLANTNEGYTSTTDGSEDLNLTSSATGYSQAITIPLT